MQFKVAAAHREPVPAIELHEWRKHHHEHDQDQHDLGQLVHDYFFVAAELGFVPKFRALQLASAIGGL